MAHPPCVFLMFALGFMMTTTCLGMSKRTVTASPEMPTWTVRDDNNNICMLMAMNATLMSLFEDYPVPESAEAKPVTGSCRDDWAYFTLSWPVLGYPRFEINILFKKNGGTYKMDEVNGTENADVFSFSSWSEQSSSFPSAAVGRSMTCDDFTAGSLYFHSYQFQPFAQQSSAGFGEGEQCSDGGLLLFVVIVVAILFLLVIGAVVAVVAFLILRKKRNAGAGFSTFQ